ncbi:MAG: hypothetical protein M9919_04250 [Burkholderiaceae bacterium]|jgi:hypothetical protein|nr:hypothetical protein [Burkholderiaceae bacterium]MCO5103199.1 hypothetical protein [Burkholderiaceae bacterium]
MPMELLRELARTPLPCTLSEDADIDRLRVLRAAGYVAAMLPTPGSQSRLGRVLAITPQGRQALLRQASGSGDAGPIDPTSEPTASYQPTPAQSAGIPRQESPRVS